MNDRKKGLCMVMRMPIRLEQITSLEKIKALMENYRNFKLVGYGTALRYSLAGNSFAEAYGIEIGKDYLILEIRSADSPVYGLRTSLNILIGICAILKDYCYVDFGSMYPYLSYELNREQINYYSNNLHTKLEQNSSDLLLAKRINSLLRRNMEVERLVEGIRNEFLEVISQILVFEALHRTVSVLDIARKYKVRREYLDIVLGDMGSYGYRIIRHEKEKFSVVRI